MAMLCQTPSSFTLAPAPTPPELPQPHGDQDHQEQTPVVPLYVLRRKALKTITPAVLPPTGFPGYDDCFDKKFQIRGQCQSDDLEFLLPPVESIYTEHTWDIPAFYDLAWILEKSNRRLHHLDSIDWTRHAKQMDPSGLVGDFVGANYSPEFATRDWCSLIEILGSYPLLPRLYEIMWENNVFDWTNSEVFRIHSVHLSEEPPGAFICALNHWFKTKYAGIKWSYSATTLNPGYEGNSVQLKTDVPKSVLGSCASLPNWTFGNDDTGNLVDIGNILYFMEKFEADARGGSGIFLVTANGGEAGPIDPGEKETGLGKLVLAEIITGLMVLQKGGSFILKILSFFECGTVCLLYLLSAVFNEVHLQKPLSSEEGTSEVYVICLGYKGLDFDKEEAGDKHGDGNFRKILSVLLGSVERGKRPEKTSQESSKSKTPIIINSIFGLDTIPDTFLVRITRAAEFFVGKQIQVTDRNLSTFTSDPPADLVAWKLAIARAFGQNFGLEELKPKDRLYPGIPSLVGGGYYDREKPSSPIAALSPRMTILQQQYHSQLLEEAQMEHYYKRAQKLWEKLRPYQVKPIKEIMNVQLQGNFPIPNPQDLTYGKPYTSIRSSPFLSSEQLEIRNQFVSALQSERPRSLGNYGLDFESEDDHWCDNRDLVKDKLREILKFGRRSPLNQGLPQKFCCAQTLAQLYALTDQQIVLSRLTKLAKILLGTNSNNCSWKRLHRGQSIWLCEFPLVTRLHVGMLLAIKGLFREIRLIYSVHLEIHGILLYSFLGPPRTDTPIHTLLTTIVSQKGLAGMPDPAAPPPAERVLLSIYPNPGGETQQLTKLLYDYNQVGWLVSMASLLHYSTNKQTSESNLPLGFKYVIPPPESPCQTVPPLDTEPWEWDRTNSSGGPSTSVTSATSSYFGVPLASVDFHYEKQRKPPPESRYKKKRDREE